MIYLFAGDQQNGRVMKRLFAVTVSLLLGFYIAGCDRINDYGKEEVTVSVPYVIHFGNLTEIIIDPGQEKCRIVHEHFNRKHGDAFHVPYSRATVYSVHQKYIISDKEIGNGAIRINGKEYSLRKSNPVISMNYGIKWTSDKFEQGPDRTIRNAPWVYPLKKSLLEILKK